MNTETDTKKKTESKEFERFDDLLRKVISVPKDEIKKREKTEKESTKRAHKRPPKG